MADKPVFEVEVTTEGASVAQRRDAGDGRGGHTNVCFGGDHG